MATLSYKATRNTDFGGLDIPMPVILIGAIGGMMMSGILGLFVGAIVLALGYELFIAWLNNEKIAAEQ